MTKLLNNVIRSVIASVVLGGACTMVAPTAEAATATCTKVFEPAVGNGRLRVPASSTYSYSCLLGQGNANAAVTALQDALNFCYGAGISADGVFGSHTKSALESAQRREGISADGVYGPTTSSHLKFMAVSEITDQAYCGGRR